MAAIITDDFRKNLAAQLIEEIADTGASSPNYYIGIGKSDPWSDTATDEDVVGFSAPLPDDSMRQREEVKDNLIGLVEVERTSRVIPRIEFQIGQIYKRYDPSDPTVFIPTVSGNDTLQPCYAIYQEKLYVCLRNKASASNPNGVTATQNDEPQTDNSNDYILNGGASGANYQWAYIADVQPVTTGFNTSQFVEVSTSNISAATTAASTTGFIYGVKMISSGQNYSSDTVVNIVGNNADFGGGGTGLTPGGSDLNVTINASGEITFVDINNGISAQGGWTEASIIFTDSTGSGAEGVVLVSPINGFGYNAAEQLPSYYVGLESSLAGTLEGDTPVIPYRQVSLLRGTAAEVRGTEGNLGGGGSVYDDDEALDTLRYFQLGSGALSGVGGIVPGDIIEVDPDGAGTAENIKAFVDYFDDQEDRLFFHQNNNDLINKKSFPGNGSLRILDRETGAELLSARNYGSIITSEYNQGSGDVLFYENRNKITRSTQQTEDIKLVIQL